MASKKWASFSTTL